MKRLTGAFFKKQNNLKYDFIFNGYPEGFPLDAKQAGRKVKVENPLLRSGIALAGANNALRFGGTERSDGIVTAEKSLV